MNRHLAFACCLALAPIMGAAAQQFPTRHYPGANNDDYTKRIIFAHGVFSDGTTWTDNVNALRATFPSVSISAPTLPWTHTLPYIVASLPQARIVNSVLVGHSQGGVVVRRRAQIGALQGYAAIGAPLHGAPFADVENHTLFLEALSGTVQDVYAVRNNLGYLDAPYNQIDDAYSAGDWVAANWPWLFGSFVDLVAPIYNPDFADLQTTSPFIQALNSGVNVQQERDSTAGSIAFVFGQNDYYTGLFWRLLFSAATGGSWLGYSAAGALTSYVYAAGYNYLNLASEAFDQSWDYGGDFANELDQLSIDAYYAGMDLLTFDLEYCWDISQHRVITGTTVMAGTCSNSDGFIPTWSQSAGANVVVPMEPHLHPEEIPFMAGKLGDKLKQFGILSGSP